MRNRTHGLEVGGAQIGSGRVDTDPRRMVDEDLGDKSSRGVFVVYRYGVLEIEHHGVGAGVEDLGEQFSLCPGANK